MTTGFYAHDPWAWLRLGSGLGMSSISQVCGVFLQDEAKLGLWLQKVDRGTGLATRASQLIDQGRLRRDVNTTLLGYSLAV
jgi:hypothetical protein